MVIGLRSYLPWPLILVILSISCLSEGRHHHQKLPSAVVVGTVYCDTCFQDYFSKGGHYISGATVAVECEQGSSRPSFYQEVKTDKKGTFRVSLPFSISKHVREIQGCTVKLVKSSEPYCAIASTATSSAIHLKERKKGKHIFSAGFFTFKPLKQPGLCNQQPSITNSKLNSLQGLLPDTGIPNLPLMPPLPNLPLLPPLPPLPGIPTIPSLNPIPQKPIEPFEEKRVENGEVSQSQFFFFPPIISPPSSGILPPNPLQPPPLLPNPFQPPPTPLIPNPFQPPTPPPSFLPPLPPLPPLPNLPPLPLVPGLTPASPPPSPPAFRFPFPLPPFTPGIPIPPASVNAKKVNP